MVSMVISTPAISVIIPHLNQPDGLEACLASLDAQSLERSYFEVIVVDNGSFSNPEDVIRKHPGTNLLRELQPGPGPARNLGSRHAASGILAFIDADCLAEREWLQNALQTMNSSPEKTILGGDVRIWRDRTQKITAIEAYESVFGFRNKLYIEQHHYSVTANLVVRRSDFLEIGAFSGIAFAEDMEWGQLALQTGFRLIFAPKMIVFHPARRSLRELCKKWDRQIQHYLNKEREQGNPAWRIRWIFRALAVLGSPAIDFANVLRSDRIEEGGWARAGAILVLLAIRTHRAWKMLNLLFARNAVTWNRPLRS